MQTTLIEVSYPEHGEEVTLPRVVLVTEDNDNVIKGIDLKKFIETGDVKESYRAMKKSKIPHRGLTVISWPELDKDKDFPYPREERLKAITKSLTKTHQKAA